jgi:hypothetical protein
MDDAPKVREEEDSLQENEPEATDSGWLVRWMTSDKPVYWVAAILFLGLFVPFLPQSWHVQAATLSAYSVLMIGLTFRNSDYSLGDIPVQRKLPLLLSMHSFFLAVIYSCESYALALQPHLPEYWNHFGRRSPSLFFNVLGVFVLLVYSVQRFSMRRILDDSIKSAHDGA